MQTIQAFTLEALNSQDGVQVSGWYAALFRNTWAPSMGVLGAAAFLLLAAVVYFFIVRPFARFAAKVAAATPPPPQVQLLTEIRDLLKDKK